MSPKYDTFLVTESRSFEEQAEISMIRYFPTFALKALIANKIHAVSMIVYCQSKTDVR
jgi:acid stress-induced BolA-like protein IbaG/YrbA